MKYSRLQEELVNILVSQCNFRVGDAINLVEDIFDEWRAIQHDRGSKHIGRIEAANAVDRQCNICMDTFIGVPKDPDRVIRILWANILRISRVNDFVWVA